MSPRISPSLNHISLLSVLLFAALALCSPFSAFAYCPVPEIRANGEFFKSDAVFTGTVLSIRKTPDARHAPGGWLYRMRIEETFRGSTRDELTVYTEDSDVRFPLDMNQEYLLFAYRRHGRLEIDSCGNSSLLTEAGELLRKLTQLRHPEPFGEIEGWVAAETDGIDVSGVRVSIRSHSKTYNAVTDKDGWFHFQAPPGHYKLDFASKEYYLNGGDDFWYESNGFSLHAGECASLQVVSIRHRPNNAK
jgi:hypothetical protein